MSLTDAVAALFAPGQTGHQVGVEIELIAVTDEPAPEPAHPAIVAAHLDPAFKAMARPSFEPGGQLELSPPPQPGLEAALSSVDRVMRRAAQIADDCGIRLLGVGTNPFHSIAQVPLHVSTPRYEAMQELFDQTGPAGRQMMRLTASLQVNVDTLPGASGAEQWIVANLAGPALAAHFANSPTLDGQPGLPGSRTHIWQGIDPSRTGYDGRHLDFSDPIGAYAAFAAQASRLPVERARDHRYHLTTLFPPVRPRGGYLEVRYLDAQPLDRVAEAVTVVTTLLQDQAARREALELLLAHAGDIASQWHGAARGRSSLSEDLMSIARGRLVSRD